MLNKENSREKVRKYVNTNVRKEMNHSSKLLLDISMSLCEKSSLFFKQKRKNKNWDIHRVKNYIDLWVHVIIGTRRKQDLDDVEK